jgi:hypothetical protein
LRDTFSRQSLAVLDETPSDVAPLILDSLGHRVRYL